jgi:KUP system potassium uptake protein
VGLDDFISMLAKSSVARASGTAVFLTGNPNATPTALLHNMKHNKVLHANNIVLNVITEDTPRVSEKERITFRRLSDSFASVTVRFGYMESPNVPTALTACRSYGVIFDVMSTSFFLSRRALRPAVVSRMPRWQEKLFMALARSSDDASRYFHIPSGRAVEIGTQITI